jgi:hypothetical protein
MKKKKKKKKQGGEQEKDRETNKTGESKFSAPFLPLFLLKETEAFVPHNREA